MFDGKHLKIEPCGRILDPYVYIFNVYGKDDDMLQKNCLKKALYIYPEILQKKMQKNTLKS